MKYKIIGKYKQDTIILEGEADKPYDNQPLYYKKTKAAVIYDTIGKTTSPYYIAKIIDKEACEKAKELEI